LRRRPDEYRYFVDGCCHAGDGGNELAQTFQAIYPHIKVLFMSGYTEEIVIRHGVEQEGVAFIQKPLIPNKLVLKLREVLDGK